MAIVLNHKKTETQRQTIDHSEQVRTASIKYKTYVQNYVKKERQIQYIAH